MSMDWEPACLAMNTVLCSDCRLGEFIIHRGNLCLPQFLSYCISPSMCQQQAFVSSPLPSHLLHPAPKRSQHLKQHPLYGAAVTSGCNVSAHCLDLTLLISGFSAERRLKNRKQNKPVRKSGICAVSLKAEWSSRQQGRRGGFGAPERGCFSWMGMDFITYFLFCRFSSLDIFTTWFLV